mmetsp:Transcript_16172/g.27600  ORF Transcript_16172/g.27600 Transcript_16172/m.27600 type:complete len:326 (-) Transcript_16172:242-1219(-)
MLCSEEAADVGLVENVAAIVHSVVEAEGGRVGCSSAPGYDEVLTMPSGRLCGTPGCVLRDHHDGAHSTELRLQPRRPTPPQPKQRRHSPRFLPQTFPWHLLDLDLQATVLSHLHYDAAERIRIMTRLARHLRPLRLTILRALRLDARVSGLLDARWVASRTKLVPSVSALHCNWLYAHVRGAMATPVDEHVAMQLQLRWDAATPCRWRWKLHIAWDVMSPRDGCVRAVSYDAALGAAARVGLPPATGRVRRHNVLRGVSAHSPTLREMHQSDVCWCRRLLVNFEDFQVSTAGSALRMVSLHRDIIIEWVLPPEALCVMDLVGALV